MVDIYFVTSVLNIVWYIFSILFVLYRFTSFFSYIYGFVKFLGKLLEGVIYAKEQVVLFFERRRGQYVERGTPDDSLFTRIKKGTYYIFGYTNSESILPVSYTHASYYTELNSNMGPNQQDRSMFDQHIYSALRDDSQFTISTSNETTNNHKSNNHNHNHNHKSNNKDSFISVDFNKNGGVDSNMMMDSSFIQKHLG